MKYLLAISLGIALVAWGSVWAISHFYTVLRVLVPVGFLASFGAGCVVGHKFRWSR
jgi:hypothetical protein